MVIKPMFPVIDYMVNYDYITKVLCENKAKPDLKCNGKCQLMKEMAKVAESETSDNKSNSSDKKTTQTNVEILFFEEIQSLVTNQTRFLTKSKPSDHYSNLYSYKTSFSIFHPPAVVS